MERGDGYRRLRTRRIDATLEQIKQLPPGANLLGVGTANQFYFLNGAAAARYGIAVVDPVAVGGTIITGSLKAGAASALRFVPVAGYVINGGQIGYELLGGRWDGAAYKAFDAAATAAMVKWGRLPGAGVAVAYELVGGSESIVRNLPSMGYTMECMHWMGRK
jgi:hypothetical protein